MVKNILQHWLFTFCLITTMLYSILQLIKRLSPSRGVHANLRNVCKLIKKLANVEQKVALLKKCKQLNVYPPTIENVNIPLCQKKNVRSLKKLILNKSIRENYATVTHHRRSLQELGLFKQEHGQNFTTTMDRGDITSQRLSF